MGEPKTEVKAEAKASKKEIVVAKVFGTAATDGSTFTLLVGKTHDEEGKVNGAKFGFNLPYFSPDQLGPEATLRYVREGQKTVVSNRFAAIFRSSNDYGTDADAEAMFAKYSDVAGVIAALERQAAARTPKEKLGDDEQDALSLLVKALRKAHGPIPEDISKEDKAKLVKGWKDKALAWKAANHKNWQNAIKLVQKAAVSLED